MKTQPSYRVLFLCTGNSARSILAEYLLNHLAKGRFVAVSAGAKPTGKVNPLAIETLKLHYSIDASQARSKAVTEFEDVPFDFILTLCDKAREACPVWQGHPITAHWGSPDPAAVTDSDEKARTAFRNVASQIARRISLLVAMRDEQLSELSLREIGQRHLLDSTEAL